jgi:hypothetical protein
VNLLTQIQSIPQDPEARSLIVGVAVAGYYAISSWSQVLVWPATQAPYCKSFVSTLTLLRTLTRRIDKYGWQSSIAIWIVVLTMTCVLRFIDVRYLRPKREAFDAAAYNDGHPAIIEGVGKAVDRSSEDSKAHAVAVGVKSVGSPA